MYDGYYTLVTLQLLSCAILGMHYALLIIQQVVACSARPIKKRGGAGGRVQNVIPSALSDLRLFAKGSDGNLGTQGLKLRSITFSAHTPLVSSLTNVTINLELNEI